MTRDSFLVPVYIAALAVAIVASWAVVALIVVLVWKGISWL